MSDRTVSASTRRHRGWPVTEHRPGSVTRSIVVRIGGAIARVGRDEQDPAAGAAGATGGGFGAPVLGRCYGEPANGKASPTMRALPASAHGRGNCRRASGRGESKKKARRSGRGLAVNHRQLIAASRSRSRGGRSGDLNGPYAERELSGRALRLGHDLTRRALPQLATCRRGTSRAASFAAGARIIEPRSLIIERAGVWRSPSPPLAV
jgi:hypothetical protein